MIAIASIICGTVFACFVVAAVMLERHKRYWQDRKVDQVVDMLTAELDRAKDFAVRVSNESRDATTKQCDVLVAATDAHKTSKAEIQKILDDAGKFSLDVSERLEALRMDLIRVETMIGMGGRK